MTQETRKDPRAKVLTMTVRYKSATLDEFIEHHSYDVSRGGMFIKTPSPFPPGTLLKFEVKISGEQRVMQGVGRVVWKRESSEVTEARPAGMGVKFIKIDDESRKVIDQLVAARGDGASAFEQGAEGGARQPPAREIASQVVAPSLSAREPLAASSKPRKATMLGLGAMQAEPESPETAAAEAFFPPPQADAPMPAPEDRTVMKQAAELLQDALREAGGSLEEVGSAKEAPAREVPKAEAAPTPVPAPAAKVERADKTEKATTPKPPVEKAVAEKSVIVNARPRDEVTQPAVRRPSVAPAARRSEPPKARSAAVQEAAGAAADSGGSGRFVLALIAVAAVAAGIYFLKKPAEVPPEPESPAAEAPAPAPEPPPAMSAAPTPPEPVPTAATTASAAPAASVEPTGTASAAATTAAPVPAKPPATTAPRPAPKPAAKPAAKPPASDPVEPTTPTPTPPTPPTEPVAPTAAPPAPVAPAPVAPAPEAPKPAPKPKAPKPAPTEKSGDNPY